MQKGNARNLREDISNLNVTSPGLDKISQDEISSSPVVTSFAPYKFGLGTKKTNLNSDIGMGLKAKSWIENEKKKIMIKIKFLKR